MLSPRDQDERPRSRISGRLLERPTTYSSPSDNAPHAGQQSQDDPVHLFGCTTAATLRDIMRIRELRSDVPSGWEMRLVEPGKVGNNSREYWAINDLLFDATIEVDEAEEGMADEGGDLIYEIGKLPTSHIHFSRGQIFRPVVQAAVRRHVTTLALYLDEAASVHPFLQSLLLPASSSHLRHLVLIAQTKQLPVEELQPLFDTLRCASSLLDGVAYCSEYVNLSQRLSHNNIEVECEFAKLAGNFAYFGISCSTGSKIPIFQALAEVLKRPQCRLKHLLVHFDEDTGRYLIEPAFQELNCSLTHLDLRWGGYREEGKAIQSLVSLLDAITASPNSSLTELGLWIFSNSAMDILQHSLLLMKVLTLRLRLSRLVTETAWHSLLQEGLAHPNCTVQFLECHLPNPSFLGVISTSGTLLRGLTVHCGWDASDVSKGSDIIKDLALYLCSPATSQILYLDVKLPVPIDADEWECAKALHDNFSICAFGFPWRNEEAKAHAAAVIKRNQLYRDAQLMKELVKPNVAKLILCGHPQVGKTTLSHSLRSLELSSRCCCFHGSAVCCLKARPDRTRGMEFHPLAFKGSDMKLLVCDLAGQEEYHVFHHYFMNASNNDVFLVVCKFEDISVNLQQFKQQLDYWLRFIASHRSSRTRSLASASVSRAPKVIVVVNFFQGDKSADTIDCITKEWTSSLLEKFSKELDLGVDATARNGYQNLLGVNAQTGMNVLGLKRRLEELLRKLNDTAMPIPQLCYQISKKLKPDNRRSNRPFYRLLSTLTGEKREARLLTSYAEVWEMVKQEVHKDVEHIKVFAALKELHSQGSIIFFPPKQLDERASKSQGNVADSVVAGDQDQVMDTMVIVDINWFCNKLIGSLLGTHLKGEIRSTNVSWKWAKEDVKQMLRKQGDLDLEKQLGEILRYLQRLELCIPLNETDSGSPELLFPALLEEKSIHFPLFDIRNDHFYGRRIRCRDSATCLLPFGVFTRLQVKLQRWLPVDNRSFCAGYGWASFKKGNVGVVVRFGGDVYGHEAWESKQWIDILCFCPQSLGRMREGTYDDGQVHPKLTSNASLHVANELVIEIRGQILATCKGEEFGGIPNVELEECVLQSHEPGSHVVPLSEVKARMENQGLQDTYQDWAIHLNSTPLVDLLLPTEIEKYVEDCLDALASIKQEYSIVGVDDGGNDKQVDAKSADEINDQAVLTGQWEILYKSILAMFRVMEERQQKWMDERFAAVHKTLAEIRMDINMLGEKLRKVQQNIISHCSTRLLRSELRRDRAYPLYPYLVDVEGRLARLKEMVGRRAVLHFLCECPIGGPHLVDKQKGKEVMLEVKPWAAKAVRVLVPTIRVICCLARLAASLYLPGAHILVPIPDDVLSGLGFKRDELQNQILPSAMKAFVDGLPKEFDCKLAHLNVNARSNTVSNMDDMKEVMQAILDNVAIDMGSDFDLHRVYHEDHYNGHPFWVCTKHLRSGIPMEPISNPFQA